MTKNTFPCFLLKKEMQVEKFKAAHTALEKRFLSFFWKKKKPRLQFSYVIYDWANYKNRNFHHGKLKTKVQSWVEQKTQVAEWEMVLWICIEWVNRPLKISWCVIHKWNRCDTLTTNQYLNGSSFDIFSLISLDY